MCAVVDTPFTFTCNGNEEDELPNTGGAIAKERYYTYRPPIIWLIGFVRKPRPGARYRKPHTCGGDLEESNGNLRLCAYDYLVS